MIAAGLTADLAKLAEFFEQGAERGGAQAATLTQLVDRERTGGLFEGLEHALLR